MNDNKFFGTVPYELWNIASLYTIVLGGNFLEGTLPNTIGQLTDLTTFRVEENNLSGRIPETIGSMTSLGKTNHRVILPILAISYCNNKASFFNIDSIPLLFTIYCPTVNLRLNNNEFSGYFPDVFYQYRQLDFFDISNNPLLYGGIPRSIFEIPTLRLAYLSNCNLSGRIPSNFAKPPELRDLYLDSNRIYGTIPYVWPGQLEKLNEFLLHNNRISGTMPQAICNLRSNFILDDLWTDCSGSSPEVDCDFPECCNRCFETESITF